jgi:hypothetical protein
MARPLSISMTRRTIIAGLTLAATPAALAGAGTAYAQTQQTKPEKTLYERLGGVFAIAAVEIQEPAAAAMAHQEPDEAARSQVHAHVMGLRCFRWAFSVQGHQARDDAAWP